MKLHLLKVCCELEEIERIGVYRESVCEEEAMDETETSENEEAE